VPIAGSDGLNAIKMPVPPGPRGRCGACLPACRHCRARRRVGLVRHTRSC